MDDIIKSTKAFLYDRTVSPLFGAYMTAWSFWNYRVFVALLDGDTSLSEKMEFIDAHFGVVIYQINGHFYNVWGQVVHGFLGPTLLTLFYLFVYPWLAKPVYKHSLATQKELKDLKQEKENLRLLTIEQSRNLIKEIEQVRYKADEDAEKYRERIASLTETINSLESGKESVSLASLASVEAPKAVLSLDDLSNLVRSNLEAMPDGEFQLSDLFDSDVWQNTDDSTRKEYGKLFRKIVERGDFVDVVLIRKGSSNQLIYLKSAGGSSNELSEFKNMLVSKFNANSFNKSAFTSDGERIDLFQKIAAYCVKNRISENMFLILLDLVSVGTGLDRLRIIHSLSGKLSSIEVEYSLNKLRDSKIVMFGGDDKVYLTDYGKEVAVDSGLTLLGKKLQGKF